MQRQSLEYKRTIYFKNVYLKPKMYFYYFCKLFYLVLVEILKALHLMNLGRSCYLQGDNTKVGFHGTARFWEIFSHRVGLETPDTTQSSLELHVFLLILF